MAEDHPINRTLIQQQLERLGYASVVVPDGREALKVLEERDVALLITDCAMPEMDGYALSRHIRAHERGAKRLPILALTASALPDEAGRCADAGMDGLLVKPASLAQLQESLARWMPAPPRHSTLAGLFGGHADLSALVDGFVLTTRDDLGKLRESIARGDMAATADGIHRIGGASKMFGPGDLADRGENLRAALIRHGMQGHAEELEAFLDGVERLLHELQASR